MPNTTTYEFGEVVLVYYYHTDGSPAEKRPAVIGSSDLHNRDDIDIVLMQVTSQEQHEARHGAFVIREWLQAPGWAEKEAMASVRTVFPGATTTQ